MTYEQLMKIIYERNLKHEKETLTESEAKLYYGEELCNLIKKIYDFCRKDGYLIYQHATDIQSADNIMKKGYIVSSEELDKIPVDLSMESPITLEYTDNIKTLIYNGGKCKNRLNGIRDELSDTQHFFENTHCHLDFASITNPNINRSGFGATCLFVVPKNIKDSREYLQYGITEPHFDEWEDVEIPETYFVRKIIPKQFCIGYLDIKNKEFVFNPDFRFNYGITDDFELGSYSSLYLDLSNIINNNVGKKR